MSKNIRKRISHAIQTTFRLSSQHKQSSSTKSKITSCCSVKKPNDYECVSYQPKQTVKNNDYIDLSECYSWSLSSSKDSGISFNSNEIFQSTKIYSDDSFSFSTFSNLSSIPHHHINDVTMQPSTFQCCRCQCHHYINNNQLLSETKNYSYMPKKYQHKRIKTKIYPFIF